MGKTALFQYLDMMNDDDMPDGAWFQYMRENVQHYNEGNNTNFDPHESVLEWIKTLKPQGE